jgi:hypothetical protein
MAEESIIVESQEELAPEETTTPEAPAPEDNETPAPTVPDKFRGKTFEDVVDSYVNLEKEFGRSRQEVGELRQLADRFIQRDIQPTQPEEEVVEEPDYYDNPQAAVDKAIKKALKPLEDTLNQSARRAARDKLIATHPDAEQLAGTDEFQRWINESPVRTRLFKDAHEGFDLEAANELLGTYKSLNATNAVTTQAAKAEQEQTLRAATLETGGTGETGKKIMRRSDLIRMRINDPDRYMSMQDEILRAYQEGRVR